MAKTSKQIATERAQKRLKRITGVSAKERQKIAKQVEKEKAEGITGIGEKTVRRAEEKGIFLSERQKQQILAAPPKILAEPKSSKPIKPFIQSFYSPDIINKVGNILPPDQERQAIQVASALYRLQIPGGLGALAKGYEETPNFKNASPAIQKRALELNSLVGQGIVGMGTFLDSLNQPLQSINQNDIIFASDQARRLAIRALQTGIENLENQPWWGKDEETLPQRQEAWDLIQRTQRGEIRLDPSGQFMTVSGGVQPPPSLGAPPTGDQTGGIRGETHNVGNTRVNNGRTEVWTESTQSPGTFYWKVTGAAPSPTGEPPPATPLPEVTPPPTGVTPPADADRQKALEDALALIDADPNIPPDLKEVFKSTIRNWDPSKEINVQNVLDEFKRIKDATIDPQFRERVTQYINDFQTQAGEMEAQRERELEQERFVSGESIRQAQAGLETSGLTFSGKAVEQLGEKSAFARPGTPAAEASGIALQQPFGGLFFEGTVNQATRLMSSSAEARRRQQQNLLRRGAEATLGSAGVSGLGFQGFGDVSQGTIEQQRQSALAGTLQQLLGQGRQQTAAQQPLNYTR